MATIPEQLKEMGFGCDMNTFTGYRMIDGFGFTIKLDTVNRMYTLSVPCAVHSQGEAAQLDEAARMRLNDPQNSLKNAGYDGRTLTLVYFTKNMVLKVSDSLGGVLNICMELIRQFNAVPICSQCGRADSLSIYGLEHNVRCLCPHCFSEIQSNISKKNKAQNEIAENVPLGVLGAVMGGVAGAVVWLLFSLMGKIVFAAGMAAAVLSFYAYRWLARKVSRPGLVLSLVIGFVMMLIGMYFAIGMDVFFGLKDIGHQVSFGEALGLIPDYIRLNLGAVLFNNFFGVFTYFAGAVICILQYRNDRKIKGRAVMLA